MGKSVIALDCDTNPNLGLSLGVGESETQRILTLRQQVDEGEVEHALGWDDLLDRFGTDAPDGVRLGIVNRIENPEPSCPCCGLSPERLLSQAKFRDSIVIGDFEAGLGSFSRVGDEKLDVTIVVIEPTPRSIDVGIRALEHALSHHQGRVLVVANKVRSAKEREMIESAIGTASFTVIPYCEAVVKADRKGTSVFDEDRADDFILPIRELAASLN
jgi:CO dehydrogenase maturation factor